MVAKNNKLRKTSHFPRLRCTVHCFYVRCLVQKKRARSTMFRRSSCWTVGRLADARERRKKKRIVKVFTENNCKPCNDRKRENYIVKSQKRAKSFFYSSLDKRAASRRKNRRKLNLRKHTVKTEGN